MKTTKIYKLSTIVLLLAILAACAPQPAPTPEKVEVVKTVKVIETVIVEGSPVVQEKIITATPEPTKPAMDKVSLRTNWLWYGSHAIFFLGKKLGLYPDQNIDVDVKQGNGSGNVVRLVANKDSDFGYVSSVTMMKLAAQGAPIISVATIDAQGADAVLCRPDSGVKEFKDLEGKQIMTTAGAGVNTLFPVAVAKAGLDMNKIKIINVAENALVQSYLQNLAPCILGGLDDKPAEIKANGGEPPVILSYTDQGVFQPGYSIVAHKDMVKENPELVRRFVLATCQAVKAAQEDPEAAIQSLIDWQSSVGDNKEQALEVLGVTLSILMSPNNKDKVLCKNIPEDWASALELLKQYSGVETNMKPEEFYTNEFVPETLP